MKITKTKKALLRALLASYNSYIKNKKRLDSERSSAFFCKIKGSSVKYVDAFLITLWKNQSYSLTKNMPETVNYPSYYHPLTLKIISF